LPPSDPGQDRALAPDPEEPHPSRKLLENYFLPGNLEAQITAFVEHYNHRRYHESLDNLTPADVYFGRTQTILLQRERIKRRTIEMRRLQHRKASA
jgi:putative transposase